MIIKNIIDSEKVLSIVSTPIGNMSDLSQRAIDTIQLADVILCEDTRITGKLLHRINTKKKMIQYHKFNERAVTETIFKTGYKNIVLVSDAGTPMVSDPGNILVERALKEGFKITPISGPSAVLSLLVATGFNNGMHIFCGFLPKQNKERQQMFQEWGENKKTIIFYSTASKIIKDLKTVHVKFGNMLIVVGREMSKVNEEFIYTDIESYIEEFVFLTTKGEFAIALNFEVLNAKLTDEEIIEKVKLYDGKKSEAIREISRKYNIPKNRVYEIVMGAKNE